MINLFPMRSLWSIISYAFWRVQISVGERFIYIFITTTFLLRETSVTNFLSYWYALIFVKQILCSMNVWLNLQMWFNMWISAIKHMKEQKIFDLLFCSRKINLYVTIEIAYRYFLYVYTHKFAPSLHQHHHLSVLKFEQKLFNMFIHARMSKIWAIIRRLSS